MKNKTSYLVEKIYVTPIIRTRIRCEEIKLFRQKYFIVMIFQKRRSYPIVLFIPREYFSSKNVKLNAKQWNYPAKNCFYDIWKTRLCNSCCKQSFKNHPVAGILFSISKEWFYYFQDFSWKTPNIYVSMEQKNCHIINISQWVKCYGNSTKHNWIVRCSRLLRLVFRPIVL